MAIKVIIYEPDATDRTNLVSESEAISWTLMRSSRGTATIPLQLYPDDVYAPEIDWMVDIYEVYTGSPVSEERVWTGFISSLAIKWQGDKGHHILTLNCVTMDKILDGTQLPERKWGVSDCGEIIYWALQYISTTVLTVGTIDVLFTVVSIDVSGSIKDLLDRLAMMTRSVWYIDPRDRTVNFRPFDAFMAPWDIVDGTILYDSIDWKQDSSDYRDQQVIQMAQNVLSPIIATFEGDGSTTAFSLSSTPTSISSTAVTSSSIATNTGTFSSNPAAGNQITIGTETYTFVSALDNRVFAQVLLGATRDDTAQNFADAVNSVPAQSGVTFSTPTWPSSFVTSSAPTGTPPVITVTAKDIGALGNAVITGATGTAFAWTTSALTGGVDDLVLVGYDVSAAAGSTAVAVTPAMPTGVRAIIRYFTSGPQIAVGGPASDLGVQARRSTVLKPITPAEAVQMANSILAAYAIHPATASLTTDKPGITYCQYVYVFITFPATAGAVLNGHWIVQEVQASYLKGMALRPEPYGHFRYTLDLINSLEVAPFTNFWDNLAQVGEPDNTGKDNQGGDSGLGTVVAFWRTLLLYDLTVGDDIAPQVPVQSPGKGIRILSELRKSISADLVVVIHKATDSWTITIPSSTTVGTVSTTVITEEFADKEIFSADITSSDSSSDVDGVASFTIQWG